MTDVNVQVSPTAHLLYAFQLRKLLLQFGSSFSSLLIQDVSLLCLISAITPWHKTIAGYSIQASSSTMASLFSFLSSCLNKLFKCIQNNINKSNCSIAFNWCLTLTLSCHDRMKVIHCCNTTFQIHIFGSVHAT